ncbi:MAG: Cobalt-zinc-cadmium resistance protein CzcA; Cation efflux system protein CusA [uncultured Thiotrichaceae bacterium]|uniref:Cobalt-zinc-cadmium resistance protein CzcA Cation efflux system protein CusA n=1 Tax=uncultured Thiotrichaceae bacterium TaxID=298394 RepID=A0A6S6S4C2_9GAMM|nr:MAG: Cobalt-zinc-cadmium resistance protein CzcA; Cation efflux system protein CusA [uncultured Thiotrichaceae bacterium]
MLTLAIVVLGLFSVQMMKIDLLPQITYPEIRVRVLDPGVPATIMEDEITRQLEEQLTITENVTAMTSRSREGRSEVNLSFEYGTDIDVALRDASTRLDRAKRFLPESIDPPVIFKRDPSQRPVAEYVLSSSLKNASELLDWADYSLSKSLLTLPGVAAVEVGGGREREIQILTTTERLSAFGLDLSDIADVLEDNNINTTAGRFFTANGEINGRTTARFQNATDIANLTIPSISGQTLKLSDIADVKDSLADEKLRIRLNGSPGLKLSIQKQPQANTVQVVDTVQATINALRERKQLPADIRIEKVADQAIYVRQSLQNALTAAVSGAVLAMFVVYLFLGNLKRTLIIGSAIPIALLIAITLMSWTGQTLNIMTLGGLALGVGLVVDNTIVMMENLYRHQRDSKTIEQATQAAGEVTSAIIASTSTNLAAVIPFLFIGGLIGLLFEGLIVTISTAIIGSMLVALTLVPALAARIKTSSKPALIRRLIDKAIEYLQTAYRWLLRHLFKVWWLIIAAFAIGLYFSSISLFDKKYDFLPKMDNGEIQINLTADPGISLDSMDDLAQRVEDILSKDNDIEALFTTVGGFVFGRSQYERSNRTNIKVLLKTTNERSRSVNDWIKHTQKTLKEAQLVGVKIRIRNRGIRGIRVSQGEDDLNIRIKGPDLTTLNELADQAITELSAIEGLSNLAHTNEANEQELTIVLNRQKIAELGLSASEVGNFVRFAIGGKKVTELIQNDKRIAVVLRLDRNTLNNPGDLENILLFSGTQPRQAIRLNEIANIEWQTAPATIMRDKQQRMIEVTASLKDDNTLQNIYAEAEAAMQQVNMPDGYNWYESGEIVAIEKNQQLSRIILLLALFLVFVVMAVHYESLRNPIIILLGVPFTLIGVSIGLNITETNLSMPVWLGMIMLSGIVVNNTIILLETIEQHKTEYTDLYDAICYAAGLRLRPILMTTLTTVIGMFPLAFAWGEGSEMLQPLAISIVSGLLFATLVTLLLVPMIYRGFYARNI